ncbi:MAG: AEC family transporter [bacterium]
MSVFNAIAPVFVIIALGAALQRFNFLSEEQVNGLGRLVYWVGLPSLLFYKIATATYTGGAAGKIFLLVVLSMLAGIVISYLLVWLLHLPSQSVGAFVQAAFRGNLAFIGLPVVVYASSGPFVTEPNVETLAVLVLAPIVPVYNIFSVLVLLVGRKRLQMRTLKRLALQIVTNPLVLGSAAGLVVSLTALQLPPSLERTTHAIGQMSLPLALLTIGGSLTTVQLRGSLKYGLIAALIKVAVTPLIGFLLLRASGLGPLESKLALIYLACPTAASSYVLAEQLEGDRATAASAVVISTLLATISLSVAVAMR